ncbi:MAG TPA: hypothetical protein VNE39_24465 [Planctomycetota bacterium]|nr:hypothetical protein [Planctomycetota bacterium]
MIAKAPAALTLLLAAGLAAAAPTLSTEYRYASQLNEYFVRGDAAVSESTTLKRGLRLAAWDAQNQEDAARVAIATAVYFFQVPAAARAVAIEVAFQPDQAARNKDVAGFLFVRNKAIEDQFAEQNKDNARPAEEPGFFGNTYLLPAKEPRVTVTLPAENHVLDGILEVHLSAGAGQVFDLQYVQVTALGAEVAQRVEVVDAERYVADPYDYTYYYYYAGPSYYPYDTYYASFQITSFDPIFWHQWNLRRAAYYVHHPWCYRPTYYSHWPLLVIYKPVYIFRPLIVRYRHDWYRRCFDVNPDRVRHEDLDYLVRRRTDRLTPDASRTRDLLARQTVLKGREAERELKGRLGDRFYDRPRNLQRPDPNVVEALQGLRQGNEINRATKAWADLHAARGRPAGDDRARTPGGQLRPVTVERERPTLPDLKPPRVLAPTNPPSLPRNVITEDRRPRKQEAPDGFPGSLRKPSVATPATPAPIVQPGRDSESRSRNLKSRFQELLDARKAATQTPSVPDPWRRVEPPQPLPKLESGGEKPRVREERTPQPLPKAEPSPTKRIEPRSTGRPPEVKPTPAPEDPRRQKPRSDAAPTPRQGVPTRPFAASAPVQARPAPITVPQAPPSRASRPSAPATSVRTIERPSPVREVRALPTPPPPRPPETPRSNRETPRPAPPPRSAPTAVAPSAPTPPPPPDDTESPRGGDRREGRRRR